jgi:hypothetical protein
MCELAGVLSFHHGSRVGEVRSVMSLVVQVGTFHVPARRRPARDTTRLKDLRRQLSTLWRGPATKLKELRRLAALAGVECPKKCPC